MAEPVKNVWIQDNTLKQCHNSYLKR